MRGLGSPVTMAVGRLPLDGFKTMKFWILFAFLALFLLSSCGDPDIPGKASDNTVVKYNTHQDEPDVPTEPPEKAVAEESTDQDELEKAKRASHALRSYAMSDRSILHHITIESLEDAKLIREGPNKFRYGKFKININKMTYLAAIEGSAIYIIKGHFSINPNGKIIAEKAKISHIDGCERRGKR
jgi:hypothetical protein